MKRLTKADWQTINAALARFEADHEAEEPDEYDNLEERDAWHARDAEIADTRLKVHARLERYKDSYE